MFAKRARHPIPFIQLHLFFKRSADKVLKREVKKTIAKAIRCICPDVKEPSGLSIVLGEQFKNDNTVYAALYLCIIFF